MSEETVTEQVTKTTTSTTTTTPSNTTKSVNKTESMDIISDCVMSIISDTLKTNTTPKAPKAEHTASAETGPNDYSMLNYLISRLNEQHKKKFKLTGLSRDG